MWIMGFAPIAALHHFLHALESEGKTGRQGIFRECALNAALSAFLENSWLPPLNRSH
jgi:hypothetical protein